MNEKHHLGKGMFLPFTRFRIVGENNDFPDRTAEIQETKNALPEEDPQDADNVLLSTSELIDFAQGEDSHTEQ